MSSSGVPFPAKFGGGVAFPSAMQVQEFDCFVVVDFEATCEKDARIYPQEIIEFPSVLVDGASGHLASAFRRYLRPRHHPILTEFCRELTGIRQEDVDNGVDLAEALRLHDGWLEETMLATKKVGRFAVVTWGDWDCRSMLDKECRFKGLTKPDYFDHWINLRVPFQAAFGGNGRVTLQEAVRAAGLEWEGRLHCGLDDAINTAYLLVEVMRQGVQLAMTGCLAQPPLSQLQKQQQQQQPVLPPPQLQQQVLQSQPHLHHGGGGLLLLWGKARCGGSIWANARTLLLRVWQSDTRHETNVPLLHVGRLLVFRVSHIVIVGLGLVRLLVLSVNSYIGLGVEVRLLV